MSPCRQGGATSTSLTGISPGAAAFFDHRSPAPLFVNALYCVELREACSPIPKRYGLCGMAERGGDGTVRTFE